MQYPIKHKNRRARIWNQKAQDHYHQGPRGERASEWERPMRVRERKSIIIKNSLRIRAGRQAGERASGQEEEQQKTNVKKINIWNHGSISACQGNVVKTSFCNLCVIITFSLVCHTFWTRAARKEFETNKIPSLSRSLLLLSSVLDWDLLKSHCNRASLSLRFRNFWS